MKVQIQVKDKHFISYIEICLQFLGSGEYERRGDVFTLNINPLHAHLPNQFISNVMTKEGHNPSEVYDYLIATD